MIKLRIPAPRGLSEQLAIVDQAEQLLDGIAPEDDRWPALARALFVARDAADDLRRGNVPAAFVWPQPEPGSSIPEPPECASCGHEHYAHEDCGPLGAACDYDECCY